MEKKARNEVIRPVAFMSKLYPPLLMHIATFLNACGHQCFLATNSEICGHLLSERSWAPAVEIPNAPLYVWGRTTKPMLNARTVSLTITDLKWLDTSATGARPFHRSEPDIKSNREMQARILAAPLFRCLSISTNDDLYPFLEVPFWRLYNNIEDPDPNPGQVRELRLRGVAFGTDSSPFTTVRIRGHSRWRTPVFMLPNAKDLHLGPLLTLSTPSIPASLRRLRLHTRGWLDVPKFTGGGHLEHLHVTSANTAMFFRFANLNIPSMIRHNSDLKSLQLEATLECSGFATGHPDRTTSIVLQRVFAAIELHLKNAEIRLKLTFDKNPDLHLTINACATAHAAWMAKKEPDLPRAWNIVLGCRSWDTPLSWASSP
jgi:hypothetical protein